MVFETKSQFVQHWNIMFKHDGPETVEMTCRCTIWERLREVNSKNTVFEHRGGIGSHIGTWDSALTLPGHRATHEPQCLSIMGS